MSTKISNPEISNQKKKLAEVPEELTQYTCSILGGRETNEDFESINKTIFKKIGPCLHYGVYDGHAGDDIISIAWDADNGKIWFANDGRTSAPFRQHRDGGPINHALD